MFPVEFAFRNVAKYTSEGDLVVDPFSGRGTTIFAAAALGRPGFGVEINPVGWIYGSTKLQPATLSNVLRRLETIGAEAVSADVRGLPEYFSCAFSQPVLRFLITARTELNWRRSHVDRSLMAIIMVYLHGKAEASLSNQMRQTKSLSPAYSIRWWREHNMSPPDHDPVLFLKERIKWRYRYGLPELHPSTMLLGDSARVMPARVQLRDPRWKLMLTSPPYSSITNYWYDQWLRLWLLGESSTPTNGSVKTGRFSDSARYRTLLQDVFLAAAENAKRNAVVYVRCDARERSSTIMNEVLREAFPKKRLRRKAQPISGRTQTNLFRSASISPGEIDFILT